MEVKNSLYPDKAQIEGFLEPGPEGPICMVKLLKFRDKAEYEDGRDTELTGREAYEIYSDGVQKLLEGQLNIETASLSGAWLDK